MRYKQILQGTRHRWLPMAFASPTTMLRTPSGMPALCASSARASAVSGVDSAGFRMTCAHAALNLHIFISGLTARCFWGLQSPKSLLQTMKAVP